MAASDRIDDLRRRIRQDPASIAFAQLAEEHRRAGELVEAVDACRAGLAIHPEYTSARVTLGRALLALGRLTEAATELERVLAAEPDNLAALRALAEALRRQGRLPEALARYTAALKLAPSDPDLERIVTHNSQRIASSEGGTAPAADSPAAETVAALEKWLEAIHAARADQRS
jgi:tetratricopeptide (TPR) repeat protein